MTTPIPKFCILVLAAGSSSRLGVPKQLLVYKGKSLLENAVDTAIATQANQVVVILGSSSEIYAELLANREVELVFNPDWEEGMGSSIRHGMRQVRKDVECVVVHLCDQPLVTAGHLMELVRRQVSSRCPVVASQYGQVRGVPCAFSSDLFSELEGLQGDTGAREIIRNQYHSIELVEFSGGCVDIDTLEDFDRLRSTKLSGSGTDIS